MGLKRYRTLSYLQRIASTLDSFEVTKTQKVDPSHLSLKNHT